MSLEHTPSFSHVLGVSVAVPIRQWLGAGTERDQKCRTNQISNVAKTLQYIPWKLYLLYDERTLTDPCCGGAIKLQLA